MKSTEIAKMIGSLPPLSEEELKKTKQQIIEQTKNIWKEGAKLGHGSRLLRNAEWRLAYLNQFQAPADLVLEPMFHELLFRAWYNVWWARDYSIDGWLSRYQNDKSSCLNPHCLKEFSCAVDGIWFNHLHVPPFTFNGDMELVPSKFTQNRYHTLQRSGRENFIEGAIISGNDGALLKLLRDQNRVFEHAYIQHWNKSWVALTKNCWFDGVADSFDPASAKNAFFQTDIKCVNNGIKLTNSSFEGSRFLGACDFSLRLGELSEEQFCPNIFVTKRLTLPLFGGK